MSIGPPVSEIQHFQNLTLKIQGQGHNSRSQSRYNTLSTHVPFVPCRSSFLFLGYSYFKIFKIQGQGHGWGQSWKSQHEPNIQSTHIPFVPCQSGILFLSYDFFSKLDLENQRSVQSHNMGVTSYQLTSLSFHINQTSHSWDTAFSKFDVENSRSRSRVR